MPLPMPDMTPSGQRPNPSFGHMSENLTEAEMQQRVREKQLEAFDDVIESCEHDVVESAKVWRRAREFSAPAGDAGWAELQDFQKRMAALQDVVEELVTTVDALLNAEEERAAFENA